MKIFIFPRQVGRGDGELGEKVAKESEEEGDLLVGDQRLKMVIVVLISCQ